jgi:hypothetical protein
MAVAVGLDHGQDAHFLADQLLDVREVTYENAEIDLSARLPDRPAKEVVGTTHGVMD